MSPKKAGEQDDAYPGSLVQIDERHRVINCQHDRQWIVQLRDSAAQPWRNAAFYRRRVQLIGHARRRAGGLSPEAEAVLCALPEIHP